MPDAAEYRFGQIHIDVARNSTDDFNPFHDPHRFDRILSNPYPLPIVLGFQLECHCGFLVERLRGGAEEQHVQATLRFRNFQFTFADALWRDEPCTIEVKPTALRTDPPALSNRVLVKKSAGHGCDVDDVPLPSLRHKAAKHLAGNDGAQQV